MPATLTQLLERSATLYPDHCAYRFGEKAINYSELLAQAAALGSYLRELGIRRGDRVGILLNKSIDTVIAVYGVLNVGAAYVPIDNTAPEERVHTIINQCKIDVVITQSRFSSHLQINNIQCIVTDKGRHWTEALRSNKSDNNKPHKEDIAYIIFTSGSTGTPKGIVHSHASAIAFAKMMSKRYDLHSGDRITGLSPLHFDMSTFDLFAADYVGACTILYSEAHQKIAASLIQLTERESVSVWYSTPFSLIQSLDYGALEQRDLSNLRWIIYAGEPFPVHQIKRLRSAFPATKISNAYGPAEVNVCHAFDLPSKEWQGSDIPIGLPCSGVTVKVMDEMGNESNQGELWVSAATMMQGYWNSPEWTQQSIITDDKSGQRYYQTGDYVKVTEDGLYHYLGRKDRQVKLRGFRVELEEIENRLTAIPGIRQSSVAMVENETVKAELCANVLLEPETSLSTEDIRISLSAHLPAHAIPKAIRIRLEFPRTSSGKTDHRKLALQWQENVKED